MSRAAVQKDVRLCPMCGRRAPETGEGDVAWIPGNTARFRQQQFPVWKCPDCQTIQSLAAIDPADIYSDYPLHKMSLDFFGRQTMGNLLCRLEKAGMRKEDTILDYGCGNGLFLQFLANGGYGKATGYDPYVSGYADGVALARTYDCVVANDVIEHTDNPRRTVADCAKLVKPGGLLYVGMPESDGVDMKNLGPHMMRLHQPFHRVILSRRSLQGLARDNGLAVVETYERSYLDTKVPFANYRFLDEFNRANGYDLDLAMSKESGQALLRKPWLLGYAVAGYWMPSAFEPAAVLRKI